MRIRCPHCDHGIEVVDLEVIEEITCPSCDSRITLSGPSVESTRRQVPRQIGQFTLTEELGSGAFGSVWKAYDETLDRSVAVKIPRLESADRTTHQQMVREARAAAQLQHPNIVGVHEVGIHESSIYIVSDLIDGISLADSLKLQRPGFREAADLCATIADALHHAHEKGVIHRDLKPANVLIDGNRVPYLTDFGLAKRDSGEITVTIDGQVLGTPAYMSPEQARGEGHHVDRRSDIYSLGAMLYEMLSNRRPFQGSKRILIHQVIHDEPKSPRAFDKSIPRDLETICMKAMQKAPDRRYATAEEMAKDLRRFLDGKIIAARPIGPVEKTWRWVRQNRLLSALSLIAVVCSGVTIALAMTPQEEPQQQMYPVTMACELSTGAPASHVDWSFSRLDETTQNLIENHVFREQTEFRGDLPPGLYRVIVRVRGVGHQIVFRRVPDAAAETDGAHKSSFRHLKSEFLSGGAIKLPGALVHPTDEVVAAMVHVPGGEFLMGIDGDEGFPAHLQLVTDFAVDPTEVTFEQFHQVMPDWSDRTIDPDTASEPVVRVNWHECVEYAERVGKELPSEIQHEYLATNLGQNRYPWGDDFLPEDERWKYGPVGTPDHDVMERLPVFGLFSNVAEWTQSSMNPYPGADDPGPAFAELVGRRNNRVIRGGPVRLGDNPRNENSWSKTPRYRSEWLTTIEDTEIGFRCVKTLRIPEDAFRSSSPEQN